jgi:hypothetical protein
MFDDSSRIPDRAVLSAFNRRATLRFAQSPTTPEPVLRYTALPPAGDNGFRKKVDADGGIPPGD